MKTLVLGIGNPILGDDGVGFHVVQELAKRIKDENIDVKDTNVASLNLLELILGYDKLIIIDAIMTNGEKVGKIYRLKLEDIIKLSAISSHHFNLANTIALGKRLFPKEIPQKITIFAVGIQQVAQVTEEMTDKVKEAIPKVVTLVLEEIKPVSVT